ncbi:hypothetical protein ACP6PL_11300 [Dapis sp. BLCC M126]
MSTEMETQIYEQPTLKKYGTMKELTLDSSGSGGLTPNTAQDPDVVGDFSNLANDSFLSFGNDNDDLPLSVNAGQD